MIFGLIGLKGSGKSTAAKMLCFFNSENKDFYTYENYKATIKHKHYTTFAFGDNLKDFIAAMFDIPRSYFDDREYKELYYNPCTETFKSIKELKNGQSIITLDRAMSDIKANRFSFTLENLRNKSNFYITLRTLLQVIGSDICKTTFGKHIWIYPIINKVKKKDKFAVIEDIRFIEEIEAIEKLNGKFIKLINTKYPISDNHVSERDLNVDNQYLISYNGDEELLFKHLRNIYNDNARI